ncbi:hypothetical protein OBBRIDRAFT_790285 [Obba rivulosa]|uniref:Uncharacterized protein n=1 Tax=Obba rivulosa TaxID=1052685 RepID=A0A8E2J2P4_9APHY|nr:hypothetical protein OBBRIDRAFT_790285 [Obba rivulosa]
MSNLSQAVQQFATRPSEYPPTLSVDEILKAVEPHLIQAMRNDLAPVLEEVHAQIHNHLNEHGNRIFSVVLEKVDGTVKAVDGLTRWAEKHNRQPGSRGLQNTS